MEKFFVYKGEKKMKPRIFVSSTFYDLKSIREDLYQFIRGFNYEPIESENGDIGYIPGQELDKSCYKAMLECDMAILIVGGRYGSPATGEVDDDGNYLSVTHKEFRTAVNAGIPVYAFIDHAVSTEYELYKRNKERFNDPKFKFEFTSADSINVFKFIMELKNVSGIPVVSFEKTQDIKDYLAIQWADMFKKYLQMLRESKNKEKTKEAVDEMSILIQKMNVMLDSVGKKILSVDDSNEYENVVEQQNIITASKKISKGINLEDVSWMDTETKRKDVVISLLDILTESLTTGILDKLLNSNPDDIDECFDHFKQKGIPLSSISINLSRDIKSIEKVLKNSNLRSMLEEELIKDDQYGTFYYAML